MGTHMEVPKTTVPEIQAAPGSPNATTIGAVSTALQHPNGLSPCRHAGFCPMLALLYIRPARGCCSRTARLQWQFSISCR